MEMFKKFLPFLICLFVISCSQNTAEPQPFSATAVEKTQIKEQATSTPIPPTQQPKYLKTMSAQYVDSRLIPVGDANWSVDIVWKGENSFEYVLKTTNDANCLQKEIQPVSIDPINTSFSIHPGSQFTSNECFPVVDLPLPKKLNPEAYSPDKTQIIYETTSVKPEAPIKLNPENEGQEGLQNIISVFSISDKTLTPLLTTPLNYYYSWLPDGKHILILGLAYGDFLGNGIYIVDVETKSIVTLSTTFALTEGAVMPSVSPNAKYLFNGGYLMSIDGKEAIPVCLIGERGFSYSWSSDSQWGYVFCQSNDSSATWGTLRRISTSTFEVQENLLPSDLVIKPLKMSVSPNNQWLVFEWRDGTYGFKEDFGLYLVRLNK